MSLPDDPPAAGAQPALAMPRHLVPTGAAPILHLDTPHIELGWVSGDRVTHASVTIEETSNELMVDAAADLLRRARLHRQGVVLCLSAAFFDSRQVLLGKVPEDEAYAVLERKAANAVGVDLQESLFWARRCEAPLADTETVESTWLVHTRRRSEHFDLLLRLRKAGVRVRRTVAGRDVLPRLLPDTDGDAGNILVSSTGRAVYAHLFRGGDLVQESRLALPDFDARDDTYASIVQDVRQLAAFWSKGSRGAPLRAVHLFGFSGLEVAQMRTPLEIAAQGAEIRLVACPPTGSYSDVRSTLLQAFMAHATLAPDLSIPLPPRPSRVAAATLAVSLLAGTVAWKTTEHWSARIDQRTEQIEAQLRGTESMEVDAAARETYLAARRTLLTSIDSLAVLPGRGVPLQEVLRHVTGTLGRVVHVRHLAVQQSDEGPRVILEASLADDAGSAARRLERLRQALDVDPSFADVAIQPSSHVPDRDRGEVLTFTLTGIFRGRGA